jgi:hypothetical protein
MMEALKRSSLPLNLQIDPQAIETKDFERAAECLLVDLKRARKGSRSKGRIIEIGEIAFFAGTLLAECSKREVPPGMAIVELCWCLLNLDRPYGRATRAPVGARIRFAAALARDPNLSDRALAKEVGVDKKTIPVWRNDPLLQEVVQKLRSSREEVKAKPGE